MISEANCKLRIMSVVYLLFLHFFGQNGFLKQKTYPANS